MERILERMRQFRDLINHPRRQQCLFKDSRKWYKLCSAMDVIEDTSMAVRSYVSTESSADKGTHYLHTYGLLQALVLQQDAMSDLCEAIGSTRNKSDFPGLMKVRDVRVSVAGHPTKRQREGSGPHFLVQMSLGHRSLELMSVIPEKHTFTRVDLKHLLEEQENELEAILGGVIRDLQEADTKHKAMFHGKKLQAIFPNTLPYFFEKIHEHIRRDTLAPMGVWGIEEVRKVTENLLQGLQERGIQINTYDSIKYLYELLEHPINQLDCYLSLEDSEIKNPKTAYIFSRFIRQQLDELIVIAHEIDEEFDS